MAKMDLTRAVPILGTINYDSIGRALKEIFGYFKEDNRKPIHLFLLSGGGSAPAGYAFYDAIRGMGVPLIIVGSGYVASAAVTIFLSGKRRLLTPHTMIGLHEISYMFSKETTYRLSEINRLDAEQKEFSRFYEEIISERTSGKISPEDVRRMQHEETMLPADRAIALGLAHGIWK